MSLRRLLFTSSLGLVAALAAACSSSSGGSDASRDAGPSTQDEAGGTPEGGAVAGGRTLEVEGTTQATVSATAVARLNGGAQDDLVTVGDDGSGPQVTVWTWSNGSLQKSASYAAAPSPLSLAAVDVAGSGSPEVLLGVKTTSGGAVMVYPDAAGSLGSPTQQAVAGADFLVTGDLNEDGHADAVALSASSGIVTVLLGKADGSLTPSTAWTFGAKTFSPPTSATLVDFDGDGHLDLVTQIASTSSLLVLYGDGTGAFGSTGLIGTDGSASIQAFAQTAALGSSGGTTSAGVQAPAALTLVSGKFAPAGQAGVVFSTGGDLYATSDVDGRYVPALTEGMGQSPLVSIAFASGPTDVAAVETTGSTSTLSVLGETVYGPLELLATTPLSSAPTGGVAGDFDGDGNQDLALTSASSIVILVNKPGA